MSIGQPLVLILGAGINGCALARELLLNGVDVCLVDQADIASGATAYSSRLIHGGLRYLEYGEFDLVKESLAERSRLLRLAPQYVRPLELFIPASSRFRGLGAAASRFLGWRWWPATAGASRGRGLSLIRAGLMLYDAYAHDATLPKHRILPAADPAAVPVDRRKYRWLAAYYDAQVVFPERFVLALLEDARRLAEANSCRLHVFTYHRAEWNGSEFEIQPLDQRSAASTLCVQPAAVVNATGAWVDLTLRQLSVPAPRLMGGTKGSHLFTFQPRLREALGGRGVYAEAGDGRPIFVTPLGETTLVGTTDVPFEGDPRDAEAGADELAYLLEAVNDIFPQVNLTRGDVDFHYSGVRPLPYAGQADPAAVTRRHWLEKHAGAPWPCYSIIGGKLTTGRSLAEEAARNILGELNRPVRADSQERIIPGGEDYPATEQELAAHWAELSRSLQTPLEQVRAIWALYGTRTRDVLDEIEPARELLPDTHFPCSFARFVIRHEWPRTLADLVERRLMLLYHQRLTRTCLRRLAELLAAEGVLAPADVDSHVASMVERLRQRFGKRVQEG